MMKILLINPSIREESLPSNFPIGLGIISAILNKSGFEVSVYDQNALRAPLDSMLRDIYGQGPYDVIAVGGLVTVYNKLKAIVKELRAFYPRTKIVIGGGVTIDPQLIFANMPADICVHGEAEDSFLELCRRLAEDGKDLSGIAGISFVEHGELVRTEPRPLEKDLDRFPMPAYDKFPSEIYFENGAKSASSAYGIDIKMCATLLTSRGCPNQCTYCWRMCGKTIRFRSMDLVVDEIKYLRAAYSVDSYEFLDECINANRKRSLEFATRLKEEKLDAPWGSSARVTIFDREISDLLHLSGCRKMVFGVESGCREILKEMRKNTTPEQASRAIAIAKESGILPTCNIMIGMPGETQRTVKESVSWIRRNRKYINSFGFFFVTPYPGCDLYDLPRVQGLIENKYGTKDSYFSILGDASKLTLNMTALPDEELKRLREWAKKEAWVPKWYPCWLSVRFIDLYDFCSRLLRLALAPSRWPEVARNRFDKLRRRLKGTG